MTLTGVIDLWAWSRGIEAAYAALHISHIADALCHLVERLDLVGISMTGFSGAAGLFADAEPTREWALGLADLNPQSGAPVCLYRPCDGTPTQIRAWHYWARLVSVLCSRLRMAEVARLPGYDHDATVGPFGAPAKEVTP